MRDSRAGGYVGLVSTYGLLWATLTVIAAGGVPWSWLAFGVAVSLRFSVALAVGTAVLSDRQLLEKLLLLPLRDLIAVGVWVASFAGHTVTWRGGRFELKKGRLIRL